MHDQQDAEDSNADAHVFKKKELGALTRVKRVLPYGLESLAITVTVVICAAHDISGTEIRAHAYYGIATMSMVLCSHACLVMRERADQSKILAFVLLGRGKKALGNYYAAMNNQQSEEMITYQGTSRVTTMCWAVVVFFYAKSIHEHELYAPMALAAGCALILAVWKLWCVTREEKLNINELIDALMDSAARS